jgi:hypothetical protein
MRRRLLLCAALAALGCGAFPAASAAETVLGTPEGEGGFRVRGSHDYLISVAAYSDPADGTGTLYLTASRRGAFASYRFPATVTPGEIHADLGSLGRVDVVRQLTGRVKTATSSCLRSTWVFAKDVYEGTVEFHGEEGYTDVTATSAPLVPYPFTLAWALGFCEPDYVESIGSAESGARLRVRSFAPGRDLSLQVNKNGPRSRTVYRASLRERRPGILIDRELTGEALAGAFRFGPHLRTAWLSPPAPFSGSASLRRRKSSVPPVLSGDLKLTFPGRPNVSLTGPAARVSIAHARFTRG